MRGNFSLHHEPPQAVKILTAFLVHVVQPFLGQREYMDRLERTEVVKLWASLLVANKHRHQIRRPIRLEGAGFFRHLHLAALSPKFDLTSTPGSLTAECRSQRPQMVCLRYGTDAGLHRIEFSSNRFCDHVHDVKHNSQAPSLSVFRASPKESKAGGREPLVPYMKQWARRHTP